MKRRFVLAWGFLSAAAMPIVARAQQLLELKGPAPVAWNAQNDGAESPDFLINVHNNAAPPVPNQPVNQVVGYQLLLTIVRDSGSGDLRFSSDSRPAGADYILGNQPNNGVVVRPAFPTAGNVLIFDDDQTLDGQFFAGGADKKVTILHFDSTNSADGVFKIMAVRGLGKTEWADKTYADREFTNATFGDGSVELGRVNVTAGCHGAWGIDGDGIWTNGGNWTGMLPVGAGCVANLGAVINAPRTITLPVPVTIGEVNFDNANRYTIAGSASAPLTLDAVSGSCALNVISGSHTISAPLTMVDNTEIDVEAGAELIATGSITISPGLTLIRSGAGTLTVQSTLNAPGPTAIKINGGVTNFVAANNNPNVTISMDPGTINVGANQTVASIVMSGDGNVINVGRASSGSLVSARLTASNLTAGGPSAVNVLNSTLVGNTASITGLLSVQASSTLVHTGPGALKAAALSIDPSAQLDLTNGGMIVDYSGPSPLTAVKNLIASGYAGGSWTGSGISSSAAASSPTFSTALGFAEAYTLFIGQPFGEPLDNDAIVVFYTLYGDADLNKTVDTIDFNYLAINFARSGKSWRDGDFNYDGIVDTVDFNLLAGNFAHSLPAPSVSSSVISVPEPCIWPLAFSIVALRVRSWNRHPSPRTVIRTAIQSGDRVA